MADAHHQQHKITPQLRLPKPGTEATVALAGTLFSATLLVLTAVHAGALWRDEINTLSVAQMPSLSEVWQNMPFESFPPLWPLLERGFGILGMAGSDVEIRILGLCIGLLILVSLWLSTRCLGSRAPTLSVGLLGSLPAFIFIAGGNRAYGLAACLLVLSFGAIWRVLELPTRARMFAAGLVCLLYAHCVYYDAVFLAAMLAGGAAVAIRRRAWKVLAGLVGIGAISAITLLIYLPIIRRGSAYVPLSQSPLFQFSVLWNKLGEAVTARSSGFVGPNGPEIWVWIALASGALVVTLLSQRSRTCPESETKLVHRAADLALFCSVSMVLGVAGMLAFLYHLHYLTQPWYYLQILVVCGISLEGILGANFPALFPWGLLRIGFLVTMMACYAKSGWREAHTRRSDMDSIGGILNQEASPGDFAVVNSAWEGISFARYYHGTTHWATIPPVDSHLVHRSDLVFKDMCETAPMTPVLCDITNALQQGHRVWMVGYLSPPWQGVPPQPCPPVRNLVPYIGYWDSQVSAALLTHAVSKKVWNVSKWGRISCTENVPLTEFSGYRAGPSTAPSSQPEARSAEAKPPEQSMIK